MRFNKFKQLLKKIIFIQRIWREYYIKNKILNYYSTGTKGEESCEDINELILYSKT